MPVKKIDLKVSGGFFLLLSAALLILPLRFVIAWFVAAAAHEFGHMIALKDQILTIKILPTGAKIQTIPIGLKRELIAALAGPLTSVLLILFYRAFPAVAFCGLIQFLCNMIPIYPMDGGRVLRCLFVLIVGAQLAIKAMRLVSILLLLSLLVFSCYSAIRLNTFLPAGISSILIVRSLKGKIPCKYRVGGVQ